MLVTLLVSLIFLASILATPIVAAGMLLLEPEHRAPLLRSWFGLSIGTGMTTAVPLLALLMAIEGPRWDSRYSFAPLFGLAAVAIGVGVVRIHLARLRGEAKDARWIRIGCALFVLAAALALLPWAFGAVMPFGGGEFGAEFENRGTPGAWLFHVAPLALGLGLEIRILGPTKKGPGRATSSRAASR